MPTMAMLWHLCALSQSFAISSATLDSIPNLPAPAHLGPFTSETAHLKNSPLANEILFGQLGLDRADMRVLVEGERAELMTALKVSGLQLGDRVKIRMWMDR